MLPVFAFRSLLSFIEQKGISRILLAGGEGCPDALVKDLLALRAKGLPIEDCHSFYERLVSKIPIADLTPEWIVLSKGFRRDRLMMITKRILDQVVSLVGLILSAPLCLLVAAIIKLESRGPVFYRQERVGQDERTFTLYKFRSMREGAEVSVGPVWASEDDPRVTCVGRIIRKLRIDEIPQMYQCAQRGNELCRPQAGAALFRGATEGQNPILLSPSFGKARDHGLGADQVSLR